MEAFRNYRRNGCQLECEAKAIFKECGCLPYYFPNFASIWGKNTHCDEDGLECLVKVAGKKKYKSRKL